MDNQSEECCPLFDVEKWDKKTFKWEDKLFIKETMPTLFHIPFPSMIGKKLMRMHSMAGRWCSPYNNRGYECHLKHSGFRW